MSRRLFCCFVAWPTMSLVVTRIGLHSHITTQPMQTKKKCHSLTPLQKLHNAVHCKTSFHIHLILTHFLKSTAPFYTPLHLSHLLYHNNACHCTFFHSPFCYIHTSTAVLRHEYHLNTTYTWITVSFRFSLPQLRHGGLCGKEYFVRKTSSSRLSILGAYAGSTSKK